MTTVTDVVDAALRKAKLVPESSTPTAYQSERGLQAFNDVFHRLVGDGYTFKDSAGDDITFADKKLTDDFPIADTYRPAIMYLIIPDLVDDLGGEVSQNVVQQINPSLALLYAAFGARSEATLDATLTRQVRYY